MDLTITDIVFDEYPDLILGIVTAHNIDIR